MNSKAKQTRFNGQANKKF